MHRLVARIIWHVQGTVTRMENFLRPLASERFEEGRDSMTKREFVRVVSSTQGVEVLMAYTERPHHVAHEGRQRRREGQVARPCSQAYRVQLRRNPHDFDGMFDLMKISLPCLTVTLTRRPSRTLCMTLPHIPSTRNTCAWRSRKWSRGAVGARIP